jgi:diguanylate cyclase (GGDEF)-like protein
MSHPILSKAYHYFRLYAREYTLLIGMMLLTVNMLATATTSWVCMLSSALFTGLAASTFYVKRVPLAVFLGGAALLCLAVTLQYFHLREVSGLLLLAGIAMFFAYSLRRLLESRNRYEDLSREMEHLAYHDTLTGLPNRRLFEDRLRLALVRSKRSRQLAAVLLLDLDKFKVINDTFGHSSGDELIRITAERLRSCLREGDTVYRQGGDEFTMLLENIARPEDVRLVVSRIHAVLEKPYELNGHIHLVTASVGISLYPTDGQTLDELMAHADAAMYSAKKRGRNNYQFFTPGLDALMAGRQDTEMGLRHALDRGEMELCYQPQYELSTKQITGMEAVLLWRRLGKGIQPLNEWLSVAEETGLMVSIGEWMLYKACLQAKLWQQQGHQPLKLSIGLSVAQFKKDDLVDRIDTILQETGFEAKYLELDLAEGISTLSVQMVGEKLRSLKQLGLRITMDDVCAGIFIRSNSDQVPMDTIKMDSTLIRDLPEDRENQTLAVAITAMAERLQLNLIAKGIDTQEQYELLYSLECKEGQGELFGGPLNAKEFEVLLQHKDDIQIHTSAG